MGVMSFLISLLGSLFVFAFSVSGIFFGQMPPGRRQWKASNGINCHRELERQSGASGIVCEVCLYVWVYLLPQ